MGDAFDREKLLSVGVMGARGKRVLEGRDSRGYRAKATKDDAGNVTVEHASPDDRVDVHIRAPHVRAVTQEVPHDG